MKRLLAAILVLAMVLSLCACGEQKTTSQNEQPPAESMADTTDSSESTAIEVDEGLLNVEVTLPASFFEDESEEEIKAAAEENGFSKCTINEDGSVTYKMTKAKHKEMLAEPEYIPIQVPTCQRSSPYNLKLPVEHHIF